MQRLPLPWVAAVLLASAPTAQVTDWLLAKGQSHTQRGNDTASTSADAWRAILTVATADIDDATSVTIAGGGLPGALPFTREVTSGVWRAQALFTTEAQLDAFFPSGTTYTLTVSGGNLGTLVQAVPLGPEEYPEIPFLLGSDWGDAQETNASQPLTLTWNDAGPFTTLAGSVRLGIRDVNDVEVYSGTAPGAPTTATIPANTFVPSSSYTGALQFNHELDVSGVGGFGVDGRSLHFVTSEFPLDTIVEATVTWRNAGTNPDSYSCSPAPLGGTWIASVDLTTTGHSNASVVGYTNAVTLPLGGGQTLLVSGVKYLQLPFEGGPQAVWSMTLPNDVSLAGFTLRTQAVHVFGVAPYALSNAQDLLIGS